ncbi:AAA family ATPase [Dactylosporangium vinaceum]|uniref:AAA family ATPase n=1 Tax=Dactylosporangium vinaceum TaxID=53362 RepID=A0ABV5M469_9ACTN|nr:AAA family ATPase [Dactylosporangium vinaceum]UAB93444.1 AAA family ATPase [Dactylosporangium vinaceum]
MVRRYVITGAPGAGKTTLAEALRARGYPVVREAATDVIHESPELEGTGQPFLERILATQQQRQREAAGEIQIFDRSPACTLALAEYLTAYGGPAPSEQLLRAAANDGTYQPTVFFVRLLGFIVATRARRISLEQSRHFERIHEAVYTRLGYRLVEIPPAPVDRRVEQVIAEIG